MTISTATFTPAAAAYLAGDVISVAQEFQRLGDVGGSDVVLLSARLQVEASALQAGEGAYRLHLYNVTPPSAPADNAAWDLPSGDRATYAGFIDLATPADLGSTLYVEANNVGKQVTVLPGGSRWGLLETRAGFTATAAPRVLTLQAVVV